MTPLHNNIDKIINFLKPFFSFINCHMVNFLTDNHWEVFIPPEVRGESLEKAIEEVFWDKDKGNISSYNHKNLLDFISNCKGFYLEKSDLTSSPDEVIEFISTAKRKMNNVLSIKEFMSPKKCHEVEIASSFINEIVSLIPVDCILDAGDGKGYLSSRLAIQYNRRVLGVDASISNTENALDRKKRLEKAWNGLTERANLLSQGITPPRRGKKNFPLKRVPEGEKSEAMPERPDNYKTCTKFITEATDFKEMAREAFGGETSQSFCMSGLHTCGNLASTCLKVYNSHEDFKVICNVGCCYHLINEQFSQHELFGSKTLRNPESDFGFPLSNYLRKQKVHLGRNARMLAAQSVHRTLAKKELPDKSLFFRALLEVLIVRMDKKLKNTVQVGKIKTEEGDFLEYVKKCDRKKELGLLEYFSEEQILEIEDEFKNEELTLKCFYLIRMSFAPVIEALILLDRLLFLRESPLNSSWLVPLFDPIISPRCYCIVGIKSS